MVLVIGLTGGIGSGKSTAARFFIEKGFAHIDADQIGRDMTADGSPLLDRINDMFGPDGQFGRRNFEIMKEPGKLDRKAMADLVFNDQKIRDKFNELMFSAIIDEIKKRINEYKFQNFKGIIVDAPLLFESGANELCDVVILVTADMEERIKRVTMRDGMTEQEVRDRIRNQMDDELKSELSDYVVDNSGTIEQLNSELDEILYSLKL